MQWYLKITHQSGRKLFQTSSFLRKKKQVVVVGLKKDNSSREMLLRLLTLIVGPGDSVVAIHVEESLDTFFNPNTFHIHEDICKSKKIEYQVKICTGESLVAALIQQVRLHHATMLVIGCISGRPKEPVVSSCLKGLPPTCTLLVIDTGGIVLLQKQGTSQQGSSKSSSMIQNSCVDQSGKSASKSPKYQRNRENNVKNPEYKLYKQVELVEARRFTPQELESATDKFNPQMVISEGSDNKVYRANLGSGQDAAVKILRITERSGEDLFQEIEILSRVNHEYIVQIFGYCYSTNMQAVVHNLVKKSLKQILIQLKWSERRNVAVGVAKALEHLHHSCSQPIIHRDVRSSNILLSCHSQPQLSGFGACVVHHQHQTPPEVKKPIYVVGASAYMAPEYLLFGIVDEKIDVYSYGVVLLELITGKDATQDNLADNHESLVLQARSLLSRGLSEHLIDPYLNEDYDKEEMHRMITAARLCIMHSSSRRPTMKTIEAAMDAGKWLDTNARNIVTFYMAE